MPTLTTLQNGGRQIIADWRRSHDRWGHELRYRTGEGPAECVLRSFEDGPTTDWPASPPLQQIDTLPQDGSLALMGLGMAGASHWSLAATTAESHIQFDWACRVQTGDPQLTVTYRVAEGWEVQWTEDGCHLTFEGRAMTVVWAHYLDGGTDGGREGIDTVRRDQACSPDQLKLRVMPRLELDESLPATVRWSYRVGLVRR